MNRRARCAVRQSLRALHAGRAVALAISLGVLGCEAAEEPAGPPRGTVFLPSGLTLSVEVAVTPEERALGYMFRAEVPPGEGMVFLMDRLELHPFWMKNCLVGLDIIWMDEEWRIVHIAEEVPPCRKDPCPSYLPMQKSRFVLEVGAGESRRLGLKLGDHIRFEPPASRER